MATQAKRRRVAGPAGSGDDPAPVASFLSWCQRVGLELSPKVAVSRQGTVAGYGMVARESVQPGELLFAVPRAALLSQHTCSISGVLERGGHADRGGETPSWARGVSNLRVSPRARRAAEPVGLGAATAGAAPRDAGPGLALEPLLCALARAGPLGAPHVLARGGAPAIAAGHRRTRGRGEGFGQHPQRVLFHCAALYGSPPRSFQPQGPISGTLPPARGSCDGLQTCLRMVAIQPIPKGHEIFNTYGQMANWQLIHMYGFAEPYPNVNDTADIQMVTVREAALQGTKVEAERLLLYERWDFLCKLEMVGEEGAFVIGREEVLTEEELATTLKVLCMPAEEFREFKDQNGWEDDKSEDDSLTITDIPKLKASWRQLLRDSVLLTLQTYATDLKTEQDLLSNREVYAALSWREQQALQVRYGQKMILHRLLELTC
ncbi:N-lysine methyltransferase SETD6 isoform X2 [Cervus elaphus]|uniref:N-lysine methyltransferase SETD6 isoform X4 n=1 Tax=Cervus canadensis TaxID=1574408 RepID=UPI001CA35535|nr:N-lysine methyltransferase SETD6 isoform X4 [Cervus canadensis]XP_043754567.1 N-lysine methyltransferase SETD6 isoform X2 [Cervus elaphus]